MKIMIDDEMHDVDFWSFLKCNLLTLAAMTLIVYVVIFIGVMITG